MAESSHAALAAHEADVRKFHGNGLVPLNDLLYQQQLTTSTEVLDARSYLDRAENAYFEARYGYGTASTQLAWAMGQQKPAP